MSQELPPQINANDTGAKYKGFVANLTKSAGAATKFVALQGERTKLKTLTLPAAYRALGKDCLQQKRHLDCVVELTSQLRSVLDEIKQFAEVAPGQPVPQSFTAKAKAAGKYAVDVARQKQLGMKRDSLIANVGKAIYEKHSNDSGPVELVGQIASSIARIAQIDIEIGQQSQVVKGSMVKPKLGWLVPSKRKIAIGFGVAFAVFVLLAVAGQRLTQGVRRQLSEGRQLWDEGKHDEASARFKAVIGEHPNLIPSFDRPIIFKQVIEHDAEKGNKASAKILIEQALSMNVPLDLTLPQAKEILIAVEADKQRIREEAEEKERQVAKEQLAAKERQQTLDKVAAKEKQAETSTKKQAASSPMNMEQRFEVLVLQVKVGMSKEQVEMLLGKADESDENDMGAWNPAMAGKMLDLRTWKGDAKSKSSIVLGFVNGRLKDGGTPGYDVKKGFVSELPSDLSDDERKKLKDAMKKLGIGAKE